MKLLITGGAGYIGLVITNSKIAERHSFATHLLKGGTNLRYIQELLERKSSKTTEIYTLVNQRDIGRIKSPLDFGSR